MKIPLITRGPRLVAHVIGQFDALVEDLDTAGQQIASKRGRNAVRLAKIGEQQAMLQRAFDRAAVVKTRIAALVAE